jgi:hypothetical protein
VLEGVALERAIDIEDEHAEFLRLQEEGPVLGGPAVAHAGELLLAAAADQELLLLVAEVDESQLVAPDPLEVPLDTDLSCGLILEAQEEQPRLLAEEGELGAGPVAGQPLLFEVALEGLVRAALR